MHTVLLSHDSKGARLLICSNTTHSIAVKKQPITAGGTAVHHLNMDRFAQICSSAWVVHLCFILIKTIIICFTLSTYFIAVCGDQMCHFSFFPSLSSVSPITANEPFWVLCQKMEGFTAIKTRRG